MQDNPISSTALSVQMCYQNYLAGKYVVNRRYQRKLVWTLEEKQAFIDSLSKNYSVPLFLFATKEKDGNVQYEIIDGMQRLNAIMSFMEDEFPIEINGVSYYFDLNTLTDTKYLLDQGKLEQKQPVLDRQLCVNITNYPLPNTHINTDERNIEEIFRRINSYGKQLSRQEIRQAGALGEFPELVRQIASEIRGDVSPSDSVPLNKMKEISLSNKNLPYGIAMKNIFWVKEKIITIPNMRVSRDEELIAWILAYMIIGKEATPSARELDKLYRMDIDDSGHDLADKVENRINSIGKDAIKNWFLRIHAMMLNILEYSQCKFRKLIFQDDLSEGLVRTYQVIFLALFELVFNDKLKLDNMKGLAADLNQMGSHELKGIGAGNWNANTRHKKIQAIKGIIRHNFCKAEGTDVLLQNWTHELDNLIWKSRIEGSQYDFKTGFHDLNNGSYNKDLPFKLVEILTAQANTSPQSKGYVIIGITEGDSSFQSFEKLYGKSSAKKMEGTDFYVTGVQEEIKRYYSNSGDKMQNQLLSAINQAPVHESVKQQIKQSFKMVKYGKNDIIILELASDDKPITYGGEIYIREGNNTKKLENAKATIEYCKRVFGTTEMI